MPEYPDIRLNVLIVSRRKEALEGIEAILRNLPGVRSERNLIVNGHADPLHGVTQPPDALILHLAEGGQGELEALAARVADRRPPLIVIGAIADTAALRLAMQAGARDLLPLPLSEADLIAALARIDRDRRSTKGTAGGALTVFINAKGGCGATLLACNVAHALTTASHKRVALVDLDLQFGGVPLYFDLYPKRGVLQALENIQDLDETALGGYLVRHGSGLDILGHAAEDPLPLGASVPTDRLRILLDLVLLAHEHVVADLPRRVDPATVMLMERAERVVLIVQQSVPVLRDASRLMAFLRRDLALAADRIVTVVNRYERNSPIGPDDIRNTLACGELSLVPNDYRTVSECIDTGQPLLAHSRAAPITKAVLALTERLGGEAATPAPGLLGRALSNLITRRLQ